MTTRGCASMPLPSAAGSVVESGRTFGESTEDFSQFRLPATPRAYRCQCGRQIYFCNSECISCKTSLGYIAPLVCLYPLQAGGEAGTWLVHGRVGSDAPIYRRCDNFASAAACNWLVRADLKGAGATLCEACRLNRTASDLQSPENQLLWLRMEKAKRRLVSQLIGLGLPVASKVYDDPAQGLAYDFLRARPGQPQIMTGHRAGIITMNLEEADDPHRERARKELCEPYRTLLGHFRHEVGHYYWWRFVEGTPWQAHCRTLFGDERMDYAQALRGNYRGQRPADWRERFISAYASTHPWEDWAEPFTAADLWDSADPHADDFLALLHSWIHITGVMNEMSSAMGQQDFYPFVLPRAVVAKLHLIHRVVLQAPLDREAGTRLAGV